jgi:hypothetical protein
MIRRSLPVAVVCAVAMIVLRALLPGATAQSKTENALEPDAKGVLAKARDTYRNLNDYHFERVLDVQESREGGRPETLAELTLAIASENAKAASDSGPFPRVNLDRFRAGTKTKRNEMLQMCDGRICWSYTAVKNEYMTGQRFRDVSSSVGGSVMMGLHLFTFMTLDEGALQDAKVAREEEVDLGNARRRCYVIEGVMQPAPRPRPGGPPAGGRLGLDWFLSMLALQGFAGEGARTLYSPWGDENAAGVGEPTRVTLWIDRNAHVVVRARMSAQLYKLHVTKEVQPVEKVVVTLTDSFTTATIGTLPADLFSFKPPEGAKEVPNASARRQKQ